MQSSLPTVWVDRIFLRLQGVYGREFTSQFSVIDQVTGTDVGLENAKQVWAEELATFADWPEAIGYALKNLPERTPNIIRFRELCRNAPPKMTNQMISYQVTEEERERNKGTIKSVLRKMNQTVGKKDGLDWAKRLVENPFYDDGRPRPSAVLNLAKQALGIDKR